MVKFSDKLNNNKKIHYNNISFLKTIFTIQILYGHILQHFLIPKFGENLFFKNLFNYTSYSFGYLCECFFIISGYFLINKIEKYNFKELVIKNIIRLWPALFFSIFVGYILSRFAIAPWYHLNVIPELLFLNNAIIPKIPSITGVAWCILILYFGHLYFITYYFIYLIVKNLFILMGLLFLLVILFYLVKFICITNLLYFKICLHFVLLEALLE